MLKPMETVVLVHGLWMHGWIMKPMGVRLERCGFHAEFFSYPSMRNSLSQNARLLSRFVASLPASRVHFIGHSLGGLLILQMLSEFPDNRTGRVILAGTPYNTSHVAQKLSAVRPGRHILGRSMMQWLGQTPLICNGQYQLGLIAGSRSIGAGRLISRFASANDGVVTVKETEVPGVTDRVVLDVTHSGMLLSAELAREACSFLRYGHFSDNCNNVGAK